jgi:peptidoglycan/xylan/chitin deacetylase (PgdA/CDA1 family)
VDFNSMMHTTTEKPVNPRSRKRCYLCRTFIDKGKEIVFLGRPFCSTRCFFRSIGSQLVPILHRPVKAKARRKWSVSLLLQILSLVLIALLGWSIFHLNRKIDSLSVQPPAVPVAAAPTEAVLLLSEFPAATVFVNHVDIAGQAADSLIISLAVNGKLQQVTLPDKGEFRIEDIKLNPGENSLVVRAVSPDGRTVVLETLQARLGSPRVDYLARDFTRGARDRKAIALTFDGGSGNGAAEKILATLREKGVRCTLFLTGKFMQLYPDLVKQMVKDGHEIGNHTWSHPHLTTFALNRRQDTLPEISREFLQTELNKTSDHFTALTKKKMAPFWRAPYGEHNLEIRRWAAELGLQQIGWTLGKGESLDTLDWVADTSVTYYRSADQILATLLAFGQKQPDGANGGIILMHLDSQRNDDHAYAILPALIDSLRARSYELLTISALLNKP